MTINSRKDKFTELYEHICNDETAKAGDVFHDLVVEMARDIHNEMLMAEEGMHEAELEGDMESDLAHDLEGVHGEHEGGHLEADAEEGLADDMLGDEDMTVDGDEDNEECLEDELHSHEDKDEEVAAEVDELKDEMVDVQDDLSELKALFHELQGEGEEVKEGVEMSKVSVKMGGEQGGGHFAGTEQNTKSPSADADKMKLGGEPTEIGKGPVHSDFNRQEPTVKPTDMYKGKMVNVVKSDKEVMQKAGKEKNHYLDQGKG